MAEVRIKTPDGNNHVGLATANLSGDVTLTLPKASLDLSTAGTDGQFLKTNGSGTLSFADAGGAKIGNVYQSVKTDTSSTGSTSGYVLAGTDQDGNGSIFCASITPAAESSKILVILDLTFSSNHIYYMDLLRDIESGTSDTNLFRGAAATNKLHHTMGGYHDADGGSTSQVSMTFKHNMHHTMVYLDSPSTTSKCTYKTTFKVSQSGYDIVFNKNWGDGDDNATSVRTASSITVMEILA